MKLRFLNQFLKDVKKLNARQKAQLQERLELFQVSPHHPQLRNHALQGKLKGRFSLNISGDLRAIYRILKYEDQSDIIEFIRLGTHAELYE